MSKYACMMATIMAYGLLVPHSATAQQFTDFKPGGYVPKDGYTPDPAKVMYVLFWHHKKRTNEFDHRAYYMNADGVNNTTADKMKKMIEDRYPNQAVYVKETNERDIRALIEREKKRIKFIEKDWVDLKQPDKIEPPQQLGRARFGYDDSAVKSPFIGRYETNLGYDGHVILEIEPNGKFYKGGSGQTGAQKGAEESYRLALADFEQVKSNDRFLQWKDGKDHIVLIFQKGNEQNHARLKDDKLVVYWEKEPDRPYAIYNRVPKK